MASDDRRDAPGTSYVSMLPLTPAADLEKLLSDPKLLARVVDQLQRSIRETQHIINGGLSFEPPTVPDRAEVGTTLGDYQRLSNRRSGNLDCEWITYVFTAGATVYTIRHNLGRVPGIFFYMAETAGAVITASNLEGWTPTTFQAQSSVGPAAVHFLLF